MKKNFFKSIAISVLIHAALFAGVILLSLHLFCNPGGGGIVEVSLLEDGSSAATSSSLRRLASDSEVPSERRVNSPPPFSQTNLRRRGAGERVALERASRSEEGSSESEETAHGLENTGVGTGTGPGDPLLTSIWKKINRSKYYPEVARKQKLEGVPKITFSIASNGKVENAKLTESSGSEILDNAALETITRSSPLPFYPKPITIAVRYSLK